LRPYLEKYPKQNGLEEWLKWLPSKHEALISNTSIPKKKKTENKIFISNTPIVTKAIVR
jgi:hypothetical protein